MRMIIALILFISTTALAQDVHRCTGADGKVTFTQAGCGTALKPEHVYDASSPPPSGGKDVVPWSSYDRFSNMPRSEPSRPRVVVVGERIDPCDSQRGRSPVGGYSTGGIKSAFGRPDRVRTYNGQESWTWYETSRRPYRSVDFDENGCATSLYESEAGGRR